MHYKLPSSHQLHYARKAYQPHVTEQPHCRVMPRSSWLRAFILAIIFTVIINVFFGPCLQIFSKTAVTYYNPTYRKPIVVGSKDNEEKTFSYDENMPLIFIGGMPRSGTTLMRALLDTHSEVRCGEETRVLPRVAALNSNWRRSDKEWKRLQEAGVDEHVLDAAIRAFFLEVIVRHGEPAPRLCNKDPFLLKQVTYLSKLFPMAKFVLMLRDGRATVHSIIKRQVTITGFDLKNFRQCLGKWNTAVENMYNQCLSGGTYLCLPVKYEDLVLHPEQQIRRILKFLDLPWEESLLHHEDFVGKKGGISLSKTEKSTDQIVRPINLEALTSWVGHVPQDVIADMHSIAPMLQRLGYDPHANPPNYGTPDAVVLNKTELARHKKWKV